MKKILLADSGRQQFSLLIGGNRVSVAVWFSQIVDRWFFSVTKGGTLVVSGKKLTAGVDHLQDRELGFGLIVWPSTPNREGLLSGETHIYILTEEERSSALAS